MSHSNIGPSAPLLHNEFDLQPRNSHEQLTDDDADDSDTNFGAATSSRKNSGLQKRMKRHRLASVVRQAALIDRIRARAYAQSIDSQQQPQQQDGQEPRRLSQQSNASSTTRRRRLSYGATQRGSHGSLRMRPRTRGLRGKFVKRQMLVEQRPTRKRGEGYDPDTDRALRDQNYPKAYNHVLSLFRIKDPDRAETWREYTFRLLEGGYSKEGYYLQLFIMFVIFINLVVFCLQSTPNGENVRAYYWIETGTVAIFTVEYVLRVWSIVESKPMEDHHHDFTEPFWGRIRWMSTFYGLIDLFAILPWYLELCIDADLPMGTVLRVFRVFRLLKTEYYFHALDSVGRVIYRNRDMFLVGVVVCAMLVLLTATILFYVWGDEDPENFGSIPQCAFLSILMLTGQGVEYDGKNYSAIMKTIIAMTSFLSVGIFSIPVSILAWGFEEEAERLRRLRKRKKSAIQKAKNLGLEHFVEPISIRGYESSSGWSESVASDSEEDAKHVFAMFDTDKGGSISVSELPLLLKAFKCGDLDDPKTKQMIAAVDIDSDGEISLKEFYSLMALIKANRAKQAEKEAEEAKHVVDGAWINYSASHTDDNDTDDEKKMKQ